jgi:hypothetical protein
MECVDCVVPVSVLISRWEKHRDSTREALAKIPWYRPRRRLMLAAAAAVYEYEINTLLELAASTQPIIGSAARMKRKTGG